MRAIVAPMVMATLLALAIPAAAQTGAMTTESFDLGGRTRQALVHDFSGGKKAPLVIVLHGGGGNPENAANMTQFDVVGAREGLIVAYPGGTGALPGGKVLTWNAGHCCAYALREKVDDVGFLSALIDRLVAAGRADPDRIYVTGMSNGGMMSHVAARELSGKIAAIAPVVGALFGDEPPPKGPVPVYMLVGADDHTVPGAGGPLGGAATRPGGQAAEDHDVAPARAAADYWARANGCKGAPATTQLANSIRTVWAGCRADVVLEVVADNGHAWPGGRPGREGANPPNPDFHASDAIWAFFKAHPRKR